MGLPNLPFQHYTTGRQLIKGSDINGIFDEFSSFKGPLTALAGGGRSGLTPVFNAAFNDVTVVATAGDSFVLPVAQVGFRITVTNNGANSMQVFGNGLDTISGTAGNVGVAQAAGTTIEYVCIQSATNVAGGIWKRYTAA
jgi:hypothetical protein